MVRSSGALVVPIVLTMSCNGDDALPAHTSSARRRPRDTPSVRLALKLRGTTICVFDDIGHLREYWRQLAFRRVPKGPESPAVVADGARRKVVKVPCIHEAAAFVVRDSDLHLEN